MSLHAQPPPAPRSHDPSDPSGPVCIEMNFVSALPATAIRRCHTGTSARTKFAVWLQTMWKYWEMAHPRDGIEKIIDVEIPQTIFTMYGYG